MKFHLHKYFYDLRLRHAELDSASSKMILLEEILENLEEFYIHFGVDEHYLSVDEFIITAKAVQEICDDLCNTLFETNPKYKVIVRPPAPGTFRSIFAIINDPEIQKIIIPILFNYSKPIINGLMGVDSDKAIEDGCSFLRRCIVEFLKKTNQEIKELGPEVQKIEKSLKAKSAIYQMCWDSRDINKLGINTEDMPITKNQFHKYIERNTENPTLHTEEEYQELIIIQPVIEQINKNLKWLFIDKNTHQKIQGTISDEGFLSVFQKGGIYTIKETSNPDKIIAKVKYEKEIKNDKEIPRPKIEISEVYEFNTIEIKNKPKDFKLNFRTFEQDDKNGQIPIAFN